MRPWAYQLPLRPASECTYGGRSTFLLRRSNNKLCRFLGFFFLPAQIRSEPKSLVFVSVQLLPLGWGGGSIPGDRSIWGQTGERARCGTVQVQHARVSAPGSRDRKRPVSLEVIKPLIWYLRGRTRFSRSKGIFDSSNTFCMLEIRHRFNL